ncbi:hypothetical protein BS47DRAFT_1368419 [Hydnum rufescens UP504]|uniref:Uncharacterized protein n=1 Tax=Hydnum rufescens UP504 TaxID=1448309 RepID=A0A9P6AFX6_9AGAM|nr:hypothetical protein BS47DRAFT_1368419 [Hydnum rufescens UP504]
MYGRPNPEGPAYAMLPPPQAHATMDRYGTTPAAAGVVLSGPPPCMNTRTISHPRANSQMPAMDTMTGKAWHHTHCGRSCPSAKIHPTGSWMKPPAHNTDGPAPEPAATYTMTDNGLPHPHSSGCVVISGHPAPNETQPNKNMDRAPTGNTDMCSPQKSRPIKWNHDKMNTPM